MGTRLGIELSGRILAPPPPPAPGPKKKYKPQQQGTLKFTKYRFTAKASSVFSLFHWGGERRRCIFVDAKAGDQP